MRPTEMFLRNSSFAKLACALAALCLLACACKTKESAVITAVDETVEPDYEGRPMFDTSRN
jgi:hypothetical protein